MEPQVEKLYKAHPWVLRRAGNLRMPRVRIRYFVCGTYDFQAVRYLDEDREKLYNRSTENERVRTDS